MVRNPPSCAECAHCTITPRHNGRAQDYACAKHETNCYDARGDETKCGIKAVDWVKK